MSLILLVTIIAEFSAFFSIANAKSLLPNTTICGVQDVTYPLIVGGTKTALKEFPWMAILEYEHIVHKERKHICGGSLISERYVLTAAHCLHNEEWNLVSVQLGEYNTQISPDCLEEDEVKICAPAVLNVSVEEKIIHKSYNPHESGRHHDIALLRLKNNIEFSEFVKPICLPKPKGINQRSVETFTVAGWGFTSYGNRSVFKQKLEVPVVDNLSCQQKRYPLLSNAQICAGGAKGKDSCKGDSGGPLMAEKLNKNTRGTNWYAVGILAYGEKEDCGEPDVPTLYTRVSSYVHWIKKNMKR